MMFRYLWLGVLVCLTSCRPVSTPQNVRDGVASVSSPIALSANGSTLWVVNPDADSVTAIDTATLTAGEPIKVGKEPWGVAVSAQQLVVLNRADSTLSVLKGNARRDIYVGPEPGGVALASSGNLAYVTISSSDEIAIVDLVNHQVVKRISVGRMPWAIAVTKDENIIVSHRLARLRPNGEEASNDGKEGWLSIIQNDTVQEIALSPDAFGFTNGLEHLAVSGDSVLIAHLLNQPQDPRDFQNTVSAAVSTISLNAAEEIRQRRIHLNASTFSTPVNFPRAIALSPDSKTAYVVLAGSDAVMGIDLSAPQGAKLKGFWPTGKNPRGIVLSPDGTRAFVMNYLSRDVSVLDLTTASRLGVVATIPVVDETLSLEQLHGKILFNSAVDPRMSHLGWMSCASCHLDGGTDGSTWLGPDGPRQTQPLWNLQGTAPFHASATRDEVQDAEIDIESLMQGVGLAPGAAMPELGAANRNRSADLDHLAAFVLKGIRVPGGPDITSAQETRGRAVFLTSGCQECHTGATWTISKLPPEGQALSSALRDVGTFSSSDVLGKNGFDVPSLLGIASSVPYLHDGSAKTLEDVLMNPKHAPPLSSQDQEDLVTFLKSIDTDTAPVDQQGLTVQ